MKKRILSLVVTLIVAVSVILGVSIFASADNTDGLKQSAISLAENVTLKMEVAVAAPAEGAYAKITLPNGQVDATQLVASAPKNGDNYVFFAEVAVKDLAKNVTIEICDKDGATLVAPATTTALAYCDAYTEGEFLGLVGALKAYANAADYYFDGSKNATEAAAADFSAVADVKTSGATPAGLTHRSATLLIESETTIRHYFELAEGKKIENYVFFIDENANGACDAGEKVAPASKTTSDDKTVYYVDIAGLTPNELDKVYTVGVIGVADGVAYTCDYGVLTYAKRVYANDAVDTKNLAAALLGYNTEAGKLTGTVKFVTDGSAVADMSYEYGVKAPINIASTKAGAEFAGWVDANGNKVDAIPGSATGEITLTAKWASTTSNVMFDGGEKANGVRYYCYNHVEGDNNKCPTCGYCYENEACVGKTDACADCGKKAITVSGNASGWASSGSDKWVGYGKQITLEGGKKVQLFARKSGAAYQNIGTSSFNKLGENVFAFTAEFGIPSADQIASVETDKAQTLTAADAIEGIRFRSSCSNVSGNTIYWLYITKGVVSLTGSATDGIKLPTGDVEQFTVVFDFGDSVRNDGVADPFDLYLIDKDGKIVETKHVDLAVDMVNFNRANDVFCQIRTEGDLGRILIGEIGNNSYYENIIFADGDIIPYTPGEVTKLPTPAAKNGYTFGGWYADAALTQPIDAVAANVTGTVNVYPRWIQAAIYETFDYAEDTMLVASKVYCDHVDADTNGICDKAECKRCLKHVDADVKDTEGYGICDVCGYKTARCGNAAEHHTDVHTLDGQKNIVAENVADKICDNCGLSNVDVGNYKLTANGAITYTPSGEWSTGYAKGVADENGGYLVVARENGDGPTVSYGGAHTIKSLLANSANKVLTYEFEVKKNGDDKVLGLAVRMRTSAGAVQFGTIAATTNGYTLDDEFVKVAIVVDYDAKEIRYYADGLYVSSAAYNYSYDEFATTGYGLLQMRLSGTGSICFDSVGIYAGDLYRIDAKAAPACEHVDADDNLACDKCSKEYDDGCDFHADKNDDGKCDKCENVAFRDGDEELKSETLTEYTVPVEETIYMVGTPGYSALPHVLRNTENYSVAIIDVQNTTFDMVYFDIISSELNGNDPWAAFAFVTEMPEYDKQFAYAEGYNTFRFAAYDKAVEIPADAKYLIIYDEEPDRSYYPNGVTFKKETRISENLKDDTLETYTITNEMMVPGYGVIRYYGDNPDHVFLRDPSSSKKNWAVAFLCIEGTAFDKITMTYNPDGAIEFGWSFLTELPTVGEVVSYAEGYDKFKWTEDESITVDIPEDATYFVVYYQDDWAEDQHYHPNTITFINSEICSHADLTTTIAVAPTFFAVGYETGHCNVCGSEIITELPMSTAEVIVNESSEGNKYTTYNHKIPFASLVDEDTHFYPTKDDSHGNSLLVEYSILFNDTHKYATKNEASWAIPANIGNSNNSTLTKPFFFHFDPNDSTCMPFTGGIELQWEITEYYENDVTSLQTDDGKDYIVMNNFYGWHRVGVEYWMQTYVSGGSIKYTMYVTLFIDGQTIVETKKTGWLDKFANFGLYNAELVDGEIVYSDNLNDNVYVTASSLVNLVAANGETIYTPISDVYITCGDEFVMKAGAYTTPVEGTFEAAEGVVLNAPRYFFVECLKHADADDNFACDNCGSPCNDGCELTPHVDADDTKTCDVCGFDFEDGCNIHPNVNYTTTKVATLFAEGERSGVCADCGKDMGTEVVEKTEYDVGEFTSSTTGTYVIKKNIKNDLLKGQHFYPTADNPEGNDLLVEFTFNYNETLENIDKACIGLCSLRDKNGGGDVTPFWLNFADNVSGQWCPEAGGFESCGGATAINGTPDCTKDVSEGGVFPNIGGYGWHRIGVRIHQDAAIVDGEVEYTVIATLYVDGAVLSVLDISEAIANKSGGNYLYTAKIVDGNLVYADNSDTGRTVFTYRIGEKKSSDGTAIFLDADYYASVGKDFIVNCEPVENPEVTTFTECGVQLPGTVYYTEK